MSATSSWKSALARVVRPGGVSLGGPSTGAAPTLRRLVPETQGVGGRIWLEGDGCTHLQVGVGARLDYPQPCHPRGCHGGRLARDAQAHFTQRLPHDALLSVTAYAGVDDLSGNFSALGDSSSASGGDFAFDWGNQVAGATLTVPLGAPPADGDESRRPVLTQRLSHSRFGTTLDLGDGSLSFANRVSETRVAGSLSVTRGDHTPMIGYEGSLHRVAYGITSAETDVVVFDLKQRPTAL